MIIMRVAHPWTSLTMFACLTLFFLLWGCVAGPYPPSPPPGSGAHVQPPSRQPIATVEALQGPNVTVGGRPAYPNMPVYENEEVRTGPSSAVKILFRGGGLLQLDENTDPVFTLISQTLCVLVQMFRGHAQLDSEGRCIEAATPESQAFINSKIDIRVQGGVTTWRVLAGRIDVATRIKPQERVIVTAGQRIVASRARLEHPVIMAQAEVQELNRHFLQIRVSPMVPVQPTRPSVPPSDIRIRPSAPPSQPSPGPPVSTPPVRTEPPGPPVSTPVHPRTPSPAISAPETIQPRTEPSAPTLR
jgi:hypothetical protein